MNETHPVRPVRLERVDRVGDNAVAALIARLMDTAFVIPGTKVRFGFDALIGLVPGVGDSAGALISAIIIAGAVRRGVPSAILARMAGNVLLNTLAGSIPIAGDAFSVFFRSNVRNYELLQLHAGRRGRTTIKDWIIVSMLLAAMFAGIALLIVGAYVVASRLIHAAR